MGIEAKKSKKPLMEKRCIMGIIIIILLIITVGLIFVERKVGISYIYEKIVHPEKKYVLTTDEKELRPYIDEVMYTGEFDIPAECYQYPFKTFEDNSYICNKDYISNLTPEDIEKYKAASKDFTLAILGASSRKIKEDIEGWEKSISLKCAWHGGVLTPWYEDGILGEELAKWYTETDTSLTVFPNVDNSLIYSDGGLTWCRVYASIVVNSSDNLDLLREHLDRDIYPGQSFKVLLDLGYDPTNPYQKVLAIREIVLPLAASVSE